MRKPERSELIFQNIFPWTILFMIVTIKVTYVFKTNFPLVLFFTPCPLFSRGEYFSNVSQYLIRGLASFSYHLFYTVINMKLNLCGWYPRAKMSFLNKKRTENNTIIGHPTHPKKVIQKKVRNLGTSKKKIFFLIYSFKRD